ncbi:MAG: CDP-glycerol glycerophosphotransferase family protein [Brachybacterium sp.]
MTATSMRKMSEVLSLWPLVVNVLAALSPVVMLASGGDRRALLLPLVTLLLIGWRQRRTLLTIPRDIGGAGRYITARYLLLATAVAHLYVRAELDGAVMIVLVLAVLALAQEPLLRSLSSLAVPYAANLPDRKVRNSAAFPYGWVFPVNVLGVAVLVAAAVAPSLLIPAAALLVIISLGIGLAALIDVMRRIQDRRRFQAGLPQFLEQMQPVFYVYWHAPPRSAFQVTMWLPYLERLGVPFALVVRTVPTFHQLAAATEHPVLLRRSLADLDDLIVPTLRGVFYVNNAMRNNHMVRYSQLTHIQLLHGESDKASSATPVIRMYDLDFVAGQAAIDRFEKFGVSMPEDMFRIVGRPQVEHVEAERGPIGQLRDHAVLYAPTWAGYQAETNYSSLLAGPAIVRGLLDRGCRVVFRPHPYSSRSPELQAACEEIREMLAADAASTGREHLFGALAEEEMSVTDCFNAADAMISDVSAIVGDFLHSGKPLCMVSPRSGAEEFVEQFPMARAAYVLEADGPEPHGLEALLEDLIRTDPRREERQRWATYYLGDIPRENYADRFVHVAKEELGLLGEETGTESRAPSAPRIDD